MAFYPFDGEGQETIIYDDGYFWVAYGFDKKELCYHIGLMWKPAKDKGITAYPLGQDGKPQWFRLRDELAPSFLGALLGKQPQNDSKIAEAIQQLIKQNSKESK